MQAFSIYAVGLAEASSTTKEQVVGLMAHMFLMVQLSRDLGGSHWLQYDKVLQEWAAAKTLESLGGAESFNLWMSSHSATSTAGP